jgi:hypothetical protein
MQSKTASFIEQLCNVGSGFLISFVYWQIAISEQLYWWRYAHGLDFSDPRVNLTVTIQFTVISVVRGYYWRRHFNGRLTKQLADFHSRNHAC